MMNDLDTTFPFGGMQRARRPALKQTQRLAGLYERKRAALEALMKSLPQQAFAGEL